MIHEKKHISKKEKLEMSVSIVLYTISLVLAQLPWFVLKGKRYNLYSAYFHVKRYGARGLSEAGASVWNGNLLLLKIPLIVFVLYELCSAAYIITVILRKDKRLNIIAMALGYATMLLHLTTGLATLIYLWKVKYHYFMHISKHSVSYGILPICYKLEAY